MFPNLNIAPPKSNRSGNSKGIFWRKDTVTKVWEKLKVVAKKVKIITQKETFEINKLIEDNKDQEVLVKLLDYKFINFYRNKDALLPSNAFMEVLIIHQRFDIIKKLLNDEAYEFDYNYIFKCIIKVLNAQRPKHHYNHISAHSKKTFHTKSIKYDDHVGNASRTNTNKLNHQTSNMSHNNNISEMNEYKIIENLISQNLYDKNNEYHIKIISWVLAKFNMISSFQILLANNTSYLDIECNQFNNFLTVNDINGYGSDSVQFQHTIEYCLYTGFEDLAISLCESNTLQKEYNGMAAIAAETESMSFLKYLWEKEDERLNQLSRKQSRMHRLNIFKQQVITFKAKFSINSVIKILVENDKKLTSKNKSNTNINKILSWENIDKDNSFIDALFQYNCFEQISTLVSKWPAEKFSNPDFFKIAIHKKQTELILFYLTRKETRKILLERSIQEHIVKEYTIKGDLLYYAAEMLKFIYKNQWDVQLTKELCKNITKTLKTKDFLNCHSIILTCLLLMEFLTQIKTVSVINANRCEKLKYDLLEFAKNIQESTQQEQYISYLMKQKDTKRRTAFQIASENSVYELLETPEIGTIIKKMWDGTLSNNGLLTASSMHRFLFDKEKRANDPLWSFDLLDKRKVFSFQLSVWLDSCSMRFNPIGISSVLLVVIYNVFIYLLNIHDDMMNEFDKLSPETYYLFLAYLILVNLQTFDFFNQLIFSIKTHKPFKVDSWTSIDFLLFIFAWLATLDTKHIAGEYHTYQHVPNLIEEYVFAMQLPIIKELVNETQTYSHMISFVLRVVILVINDILVWVRVAGVLLTYKEMGPVMRMIFSMAIILIKYLIIIAMFLALCAGVFTSLFNRYSEQFIDFSTSVISLFGGFLNNFNCTNFMPGYTYFGSMLVMAYVCIAAVLFVNLLIAVLSNVYERLSKVVDASHRAILIQYYKKYKWHKQYGYLLFLTPPLNVINIPVLIINSIVCVKQETFNSFVTKVYYVIAYFPFIFIFFTLYTVLLIPFCYLKGIVMNVKYLSDSKIFFIFKLLVFLRWLFCGVFVLLYIYMRDIIMCIAYLFNEAEEKMDDFQRVKKNITVDDVITFLKFIHSPIAPENKKDIHSLFMAYLEFEATEKAAINENVKKAKEYMKKIRKSTITGKLGDLKVNNAQIENKTVMMYNNLEEGEHASAIYTSYIRKNLMIIEILENFTLDNDKEGGNYMDIDKMRKLLPMTMTIKNEHFKRLIHSDVHTLNQAMSKLKTSKIAFLQYQLLNKIVSLGQRLDQGIDNELRSLKLQMDLDKEDKKKKKKNNNITGNNNTNQMTEEEIEERKKALEEKKNFQYVLYKLKSDAIDVVNNRKIKQQVYYDNSSMS